MENNIEQIVQDRITKGIKFDFDPFFSDGWRIFKKVALMIGGATILSILPIMILYALAMPFLLGITSIKEFTYIIKHDPAFFQSLQRSPIYLLKVSGFGLLFAALFAPVQAGYLKLCREADKTGDVNFGVIFSYYKAPYFMRIAVATIIVSFVTSGSNIIYSFLGPVGSILNLATIVVVYAFVILAQPLIIFGNANVSQAFKLSFAIASKHFLPMVGMLLLFGLLAFVGVIACCIGVFFSIAFLPVCNYLLYKYAVGFPEDEIEKAEEGHWQQQPPPTT